MRSQIRIKKSDNYNTRRSKKRLLANIKRKNKVYFRSNSSKRMEKKVNEGFRSNVYYSSKIIYNRYIEQFCERNNIHKWKTKQTFFKLDADFCLFKSPNLVLTSLLQMLRSAKIKGEKARLARRGAISFGALYLIDNMCWEIAKQKKWILEGALPAVDRDILSNLKSAFQSTSNTPNAYLINAKVQINKAKDRVSHQDYKVKSKQITDMVQMALREKNGEHFELSPEAYHAIDSTIGEQFDNIVLHVPEAEYGTLCGFYNKTTKEITILIFNFGRTISETLNYENLPIEMQEDIEKVVDNHIAKRFFIGPRKFTKENAITLLALQEGISSKLSDDKSRGQGLIDYIINCFELNSGTKIAIISGNTAISIDKTYKAGIVNVLGRERRILALNKENNIFERPDSNFLTNMNVFFPGVIIETTIPLA